MKYVVTDSQIQNLIETFTIFLNKKSPEEVCNIKVGFDEVHQRFTIEIVFNRKKFIGIDGTETYRIIGKVVDENGKFFRDFSGHNPLIYQDFKNC